MEVDFNIPVKDIKTIVKDEFKNLNLPKGKYFYGYAGKSIPDAQGDLILPEAYEKAAKQIVKPPYNKVFLGHEYKDIPIGIVVHAEPKDEGLLIIAKLNENHERAEEVWKSIQEGYLDGFSLGGKFIRKSPEFDEKSGKYINKVYDIEVREVSLTGIPANKEATVLRAFQKSLEGLNEDDINLIKILIEDMKEDNKANSPYLNPDGSFKGGFDGCVKHFQKVKGLSKERASALCAYIGRRTGKIKEDKPEVVKLTEEEKKDDVVEENNLEKKVSDLENDVKQLKDMVKQLIDQTKKNKEVEEAKEIVEENKPEHEKKSVKVEEKKFNEPETKKEISFLEWLSR